jgi:hypothetical protein
MKLLIQQGQRGTNILTRSIFKLNGNAKILAEYLLNMLKIKLMHQIN